MTRRRIIKDGSLPLTDRKPFIFCLRYVYGSLYALT